MLHFMRFAADHGLFTHLTSRSSIAHLTKEKLARLRVPLPTREEQELIADVLDSQEERIRAEQSVVATLQRVKSALMSVLLTGEVRVKPDKVRA
jgi:type I restriction enzyme S subunit